MSRICHKNMKFFYHFHDLRQTYFFARLMVTTHPTGEHHERIIEIIRSGS